MKIKALLIGLLLASPPVAAWMISRPHSSSVFVHEASSSPMPQAEPGPGSLRIPVEVLAKGSSPEMIYVEMKAEAVPEPATLPLILLPAGWWLLRRRR